jgi:hypothetical protein
MKYSFLLTAFLLLTTITVAQNFNVKGTLIEGDSAFPLLGASIVLKGTTNGVVSDFDGNFSIDEIPMNGVLVISGIHNETSHHNILRIFNYKVRNGFRVT